MDRFKTFRDIGRAAYMIIEAKGSEDSSSLDDVANYLADLDLTELETEIHDEFNHWICEMLDVYDSSNLTHDSYIIKHSILDLTTAMKELNTFATFAVYEHLLLDTGAPKSLCSIDWLKSVGWAPIQTIQLPSSFHPFRFAGQRVKALYAACLACTMTDMTGKQHVLHQVAFILPPTPIPFLVGLQTARQLAFDIKLREANKSHLRISNFQSDFHLTETLTSDSALNP